MFTRILILISMFISINGLSQCLSGNFTIGGVSPDYITINDAISDLTVNGVCGITVFEIRDGVYNEQVEIPAINGSSFSNLIFFLSESQNSANVTLEYPASNSSIDDYTLKLSGASHIIFGNLSIKRTVSSLEDFASVVYLSDSTSYVTFDSCYFHSLDKDGKQYLLYNEPLTVQNNITITECDFHNGSIGVKYDTTQYPSPIQEIGNIISSSIFRGQAYRGVSVSGQSGFVFEKNKILDPSYFSGVAFPGFGTEMHYIGFFSTGCENTIIEKNEINTTPDSVTFVNYYNQNYKNAGVGMYLFELFGNTVVANNSIIAKNQKSTLALQAWSFVSNGLIEMYNNSISVDFRSENVIASDFGRGVMFKYDSILFKNNIINMYVDTVEAPSLGQHQVVTLSGVNVINASNNVYYSNSPASLFWVGLDFVSFADFLSITSDSTSIIKKVAFINDTTDLHILYDTDIKNNAKELIGFTDDIDGDLRDNAPDIGSDEFILTSLNDAGIKYIEDTLLVNGVCQGQYPLAIVLKNYGSNTLTFCNINVQLGDSIYSPINWTGNLSSLNVDTIILNLDMPYEFNLNLKVWSSSPNSVIDLYNLNDTINSSSHARLEGFITTGPGKIFETYSDFEVHLNRYGACGNLTVGIYDSIFQMSIDTNILNFTNLDTIQFIGKTAPKPIVSQLDLISIGNFYFKNLNMEHFEIVSTSVIIDSCYSYKLGWNNHFYGGIRADNAVISNCDFYKFHFWFWGNGEITLDNNLFPSAWKGEINTDSVEKCILSNNYFENLVADLHGERFIIHDNLGPTTYNSNSIQIGDFPNYYPKYVNFYNNEFDFGGVNFASDTLLVRKNIMKFYGSGDAFDFVSHNGLISNNLIKTNPIPTPFMVLYDYSFSASNWSGYFESFDVVNNTFIIGNLFGLVFNGSPQNKINFSNNIVAVVDTSTLLNDYGVSGGLLNVTSGLLTENVIEGSNNCFFYDSINNDLMYPHSFSSALSNGVLPNSIFHSPLFASDSIHINYDNLISGAGNYFSQVADDIDGETRDSLMVDIGADQFTTPNKIDVELILDQPANCGNDSLFGRIVNHDTIDYLYYVQTESNLNNVVIEHYISLAPNDTSTIQFIGEVDIQTIQTGNNFIWAQYPNGNQDTILVNDTASYNYTIYPDINLGNDTLICSTDSLFINTNNYYVSYFWNTGENVDSIYAIETGVYSIQATDSNGCIYFDTLNLIVPKLNLSNDTIICYNETTVLKVNGEFSSYIWNTGSLLDSTLVNGLGYYSVEGTDVYGCVQQDSVLVQEFPYVASMLPSDTVSCSLQLGLSVPAAYNSYLWSSGSITNSETVNVGVFQDSIYWVDLVDVNNCSYRDTISTRLAQTNIIGDTIFCIGANVQLSANTANTYLWSTGEITQSIIASNTGNYNVIITDLQGCERIGEIELTTEPFTYIDSLSYNLDSSEFYIELTNVDYLTWVFGDGDTLVVDIDSSITDTIFPHEYLQGGNYSGYLLASSNCNNDIYYFDVLGVGIEEYKNDISIYPNPTNGVINFKNFESNNYEIAIYDVSGKLMIFLNNPVQSIDISKLSVGMYYLHIIDADKEKIVLYEKIILME